MTKIIRRQNMQKYTKGNLINIEQMVYPDKVIRKQCDRKDTAAMLDTESIQGNLNLLLNTYTCIWLSLYHMRPRKKFQNTLKKKAINGHTLTA